MKFDIEFGFEGKKYQFCRSLNELDRNYDDEGYAYLLDFKENMGLLLRKTIVNTNYNDKK